MSIRGLLCLLRAPTLPLNHPPGFPGVLACWANGAQAQVGLALNAAECLPGSAPADAWVNALPPAAVLHRSSSKRPAARTGRCRGAPEGPHRPNVLSDGGKSIPQDLLCGGQTQDALKKCLTEMSRKRRTLFPLEIYL